MVSSATLLKVKTRETAGFLNKLVIATALVISTSAFTVPTAEAARCTTNSAGDVNCSYQERGHWYLCGFIPVPRTVRWQVPEGTPPAGGWRTAFLYNGTTPIGTNPFLANRGVLDAFGAHYSPRIIRELLDDPTGTGKKYAVMAPEPPGSAVVVEFWHTNAVFPYFISCDYSFFNDFFDKIPSGSYGSGSQYNMNRRFAYGISSGGYNTSRMAVTFNGNNTWKALGIIAASYASCSGPLCVIPALPANHPPTKFWHGGADIVVPLSTAVLYHDKLQAMGIPVSGTLHGGGHELNETMIGPTGVKALFDIYY